MRNLNIRIALCLLMVLTSTTSCSNDDDGDGGDNSNLTAFIRVNGTILSGINDEFSGNINGEFIAEGESISNTFIWQNAFTRAEYNVEIDAAEDSVFRIEIRDARQELVMSESLIGNSVINTLTGVSASGTPGNWSVTIILVDFNGEGSFTLSGASG